MRPTPVTACTDLRETNDLNRRLLVLSYHAPPDGAVGGLRWAGLSRQLVRRGWSVRVITASLGADGLPAPDGLAVRVVPRRTTVQDRYRRLRKGQLTRRGEAGGTAGGRTLHGRGTTSGPPAEDAEGRGLRAALAALLGFPDEGRGWVFGAASAAREAIVDWAPDVVVSTGPPHSVHLAARIALRRRHIPWVVDLRDPWATPRLSPSEAAWSGAATARLEAAVFRRSSVVLTTTPELRDALTRAYPSIEVAWLPNGVDTSELPTRPTVFPEGLSITHLGSVYFNRDPTPVLRAFAAFLAACPGAAAAGSTLRFVGNVSTDFRPALVEATADLGLTDHVLITGSMPRSRALEVLAGSHMALVLAQGQEVMVPAKLYEAVGMGVPTLVVTEVDSATGREARRLGAAVHGPADEAGLVATMRSVWSGAWQRDQAPPPRVDHSHLAGELEAVLHSLGRLRRPAVSAK